MLLGRSSLAKRTSPTTCSTAVAPAASPAVCGGLLRRPQRPGNQCAPRRTSGGTLPIIHPRELSGTAGSAAMLWQGLQESRLNVDTVRYRWLTIKRKPELCCAETVNVSSSLWKATENQTTILLCPLSVIGANRQSGNECPKRSLQFLSTVMDASSTITSLRDEPFDGMRRNRTHCAAVRPESGAVHKSEWSGCLRPRGWQAVRSSFAYCEPDT